MDVCSSFSVGPSELTVPGYSWRSATFAAVSYTAAVHYFGWYTQREGLALMVLFFVLHTVFGSVLKRDLDFTRPIAEKVHSWLNIPEPVNPATETKQHKKAE